MRNGVGPYGCPVEATLDVIGGKWKGVILYKLLEEPRRFSALKRELPAITQRMLTLQLRALEEDGLVHREIYKEIPPRVEYSLTEFGKTLEPILLEMLTWGDQYTFTGTSIQWIGATNKDHGDATVTIDNGTPITVDTYSPQWGYQSVLFTIAPLLSSHGKEEQHSCSS